MQAWVSAEWPAPCSAVLCRVTRGHPPPSASLAGVLVLSCAAVPEGVQAAGSSVYQYGRSGGQGVARGGLTYLLWQDG